MMTSTTIESLEHRIAPASFMLGTDTLLSGNVVMGSGDELMATLNDVLGSGRLEVNGSVSLGGATLTIDVSQVPSDLSEFLLIDNDDFDPIDGTFAGLPEGAVFKADGTYFRISYEGGDGNDVTLRALVPQVTISANKRSVTFVDVDGDLVTVKTNRGIFTEDAFVLVPNGDIDFNGAQLAELKLDSTFANANITITARPGFYGNGFANVGYLNAAGVDLGKVTIKGDLARIDAGDAATTKPAVKNLVVQSIGQLGDSTLETSGALDSSFEGRLQALTVKSDVRGAKFTSESGFGKITVRGSFIESTILSGADIGAISIRGDLTGEAGSESLISAFGKAVSPKRGVDLAIKSITVGGTVERTSILAGYSTANDPLNADASIGPVRVGGDWIASNLVAGSDAGPNGYIGTGDDRRFENEAMLADFRDVEGRYSQIASVIIGGQVLGTPNDDTDTFGFVAESIKRMTIGGITLPLTRATHDDYIPLASTGKGATGLRSDVYLVEVYLLA